MSLLPENRFGFPADQSSVPPDVGGTPLRLSKKYYFFDKGVCGLTAAHALSAEGGQLARLQAERYFLRRTCRRRK